MLIIIDWSNVCTEIIVINYIILGKDSDQFSEDVTDNVTADGTLVISKVTKKHEGYYVCEANNEVGTPIISIIRLNVQGECCF